MSGSAMVFTYQKLGPIVKVIANFVSDSATGAASGTTTNIISGKLIKIVTDPGSAAPSANWDVVITDPEGVTVTAKCETAVVAALVARHTTNTEQTYLHLMGTDAGVASMAAFPVVCDALTFAVANAGNSTTGEIILYVEGEIIGSA